MIDVHTTKYRECIAVMCLSILVGAIILTKPSVASAGLLFPRDSLQARTSLTGNGSSTIAVIPSGQTYTVFYISENTSVGDTTGIVDIDCDSVKLLQYKNSTLNSPIERFKMTKCTHNIILTTSGFVGTSLHNASIIYVPYDVAAQYIPADWYGLSSSTPEKEASATSTVPYGDWLFVNAFILFFLSFVPVGIFYSLIKMKK